MDRVDRFLYDRQLHPELTVLRAVTAAFLSEMETGLEGKPSSLRMIPSYIGEEFHPQPGECVAAVDAGGTNLRVSKVRFGRDGAPEIEAIETHPMPGSKGAVEMEDFFNGLADSLKGILEETGKLGFCFSYPVEILPSRDGRVLSLCKEVVVRGIEGQVIGEQLQKALERRGARGFSRLTVLNDTTASLLGGRLFCRDREYSSYMGFILGTGTNACYYAENSCIRKAPELAGRPGRTIVNLESGNFDKLRFSPLDEAFTAKTLLPQAYRMEKMISGQYLGPLTLDCLLDAAQAGLLSPAAGKALADLQALETKDVGDFLCRSHGSNPLARLEGLTQEDRACIYRLADCLLDRAARLVAAQYAACVIQSGAGRDPLAPVLVTAEGSTYYRLESMKRRVDYYTERFLRRENGLYLETAAVENAVTLGAALAAVCG